MDLIYLAESTLVVFDMGDSATWFLRGVGFQAVVELIAWTIHHVKRMAMYND